MIERYRHKRSKNSVDGTSPKAAIAIERTDPTFQNHRDAALALLNGDYRQTRKAGQFLGQLAVDTTPMSEAQDDWLNKLLERAGLPPLAPGDGQ